MSALNGWNGKESVDHVGSENHYKITKKNDCNLQAICLPVFQLVSQSCTFLRTNITMYTCTHSRLCGKHGSNCEKQR